MKISYLADEKPQRYQGWVAHLRMTAYKGIGKQKLAQL